jgi:hypothetical protein
MINILSYITPSFSLIPTQISLRANPNDATNKSINAPALQQHCKPSQSIFGRRSSTLNLKSPAANPSLSLEPVVEVVSAAIATLAYIPATTSIDASKKPYAHPGRAAMEAGFDRERHADAQSKCEHDRRHERWYAGPNCTSAALVESQGGVEHWRDEEREIMDMSASFNISLISDTSTCISTPSSSTDDLSLPPPPQLLLPAVCVFPSPSPSQHPTSGPLQDLLSRPLSMQEPEAYPYACSAGGGLGLGISVPSEKWDSDGSEAAMVPLVGLGTVALNGWRGKMGPGVGSGLYTLEEEEEEDED